MFPTPLRGLALILLTLQGACSITTRSEVRQRQPAATAREDAPATYQARQPSSKRIPILASDAVWGSPTAPATIVVFTDLECPYCARAEITLEGLKAQYGEEELRIVVKHAPFHDHSEQAARYAQAALMLGGPRAFFRFMKLGFEHQDELASDFLLKQLCEKSGVDPNKAADIAQTQEVSDKLEADAELAQKLQVNGTPTFFVNGAMIVGAQALSIFTNLIDAELVAAEKLLAEGVPAQLVFATRVGTNSALADAAEARENGAAKPDEAAEAQEQPGTLWKVPVAGTPLRGPRDAPITIVEFADYECPFCRRAQITIDKLFELYPGKLRLSRRENPLPMHSRALAAAMLALEARARRGDEAYFEATSKLFQSGLEPEHLDDIAKEIGLDIARTRRAIEKKAHLALVERDQDLAVAVKANGTPHYFVNGWRINGAQSVQAFQEVIDAQLKVAEALSQKGVPARRLYDELQKTAKEAQAERWQLPPPAAGAPSRGNKNAPVVIEFFGDMQCPWCASASQTLSLVESAFPGKVRVVWRHMPLESLHPQARLAARSALEARTQKGDEAFWKMVGFFYRDLAEQDAFSDARLLRYASELGLNGEALLAAGKDTRHDTAIDADLAAAKAAGMEAAPSISVGGYRVVGAQPFATFRYFVRQALKKPAKK